METLIPIFAILIAIFLSIVTMWDLFKAAGEDAWKSIIPIYNIIVLLKISDLPLYWLIAYFIPLGQIVVFVVVFKKLLDEYRDEVIKVLVANIAAIIVASVGVVYGVAMASNAQQDVDNTSGEKVTNVQNQNTNVNTNINTELNVYNDINNTTSNDASNQANTVTNSEYNNYYDNVDNTGNSTSLVVQDTDVEGKRLHLYDNVSSQKEIQKAKQKRIIERIKNGLITIQIDSTDMTQNTVSSTTSNTQISNTMSTTNTLSTNTENEVTNQV